MSMKTLQAFVIMPFKRAVYFAENLRRASKVFALKKWYYSGIRE